MLFISKYNHVISHYSSIWCKKNCFYSFRNLYYCFSYTKTNEVKIGLVDASDKFIGRTLEEIDFYGEYGVTCVAIKREIEYTTVNRNYVVLEQDKLVIAGINENIQKLL